MSLRALIRLQTLAVGGIALTSLAEASFHFQVAAWLITLVLPVAAAALCASTIASVVLVVSSKCETKPAKFRAIFAELILIPSGLFAALPLVT